MLAIHYSNRLESLADRLAEALRAPWREPLAAEAVVVQSRAVARWLRERLAGRLGVCANVRFPYPAAYVWELFRSVLPEIPPASPFDPAVLAWRIQAALDKLEDAPRFAPLLRYLNGADARDRYRLALGLADAFQGYLVQRPDWIARWQQGRESDAPHEAWQAELWRRIARTETGGFREDPTEQFFAALGNAQGGALPERIHLFGIGALPPRYLEIFRRTAEYLDVRLYVPNPCREYWGDLASPRQAARAGLDRAPNPYLEIGHPLLAALGKAPREFFDLLQELPAAEEEEMFHDPGTGTPLHALQSDILNLRRRGTAETPPRVGRRFAHFFLLERIARGSASEVHLALTSDVPGHGRPVVIKRLLPHLAQDPGFVRRFEDEMRRVLPLSHPGIVKVWEIGRVDDGEEEERFVAMEHVEGKDLGRILARARRERVPVPLGVALYIARAMCDALAFAHRLIDAKGKTVPLLHEDVSPRKVLVSWDGAVDLVDFGLARAMAAAGQTHAGVVLGKLRYLAPEQASPGQVPTSPATDVYAAGLLLFEMLAGGPRFFEAGHRALLEAVRAPKPALPGDRVPGIPTDVDDIVAHAIAATPRERPQSAAEIRDDLAAAIARHAPRVSADDVGAFVRKLFADEVEAERTRLRAALEGHWVPPTDPEVRLPSVELTNPGDLPEEKTTVRPTASVLSEPLVRAVPDTSPGAPHDTDPERRGHVEIPTDPEGVPAVHPEGSLPDHEEISTVPEGVPAIRDTPPPETRRHDLPRRTEPPSEPVPPPPLTPRPFTTPPRKGSGVLLPLLVVVLVAIGTIAVFLLASRM